MYLELVYFADISCRKTGTDLIPWASLYLRLSPLSHSASFKLRELDSKRNTLILRSLRGLGKIPREKRKSANNQRPPPQKKKFWNFFKFLFVLQKHCDVSCSFLPFNTLHTVLYDSKTSSCCRKLFVPLSIEGSGWCILGRPQGFAKPRSTNPQKARDVSFVIKGQGQEVCEESRYLIATPRMLPPVTHACRAGFTVHHWHIRILLITRRDDIHNS